MSSPRLLALRPALALLLAASPLAAQLAPPAALAALDRHAIGEALDVSDFTLQTLSVAQGAGSSLEVAVDLGGRAVVLALQPWTMRSPEHFQVLVQGADGVTRPVAPAPSQVWRGLVAGEPGSRVAGGVIDGQVDVLVRLADGTGTVWGIQPLTQVDPAAAPSLHVVYRTDDGIDRGLSCGGALAVHGTPDAPPSDGGFSGSSNKLCQIGIDADVEFYNKNGSSVSATQLDIEDIMNRVETIYTTDVGIEYTITTIIVRTTEADPYSSTSASTLLGQLQGHWNGSQGGVTRDVAHLFTGKNIAGGTIGIAYLNVICNLGSAYGLSESKFTSNKAFRAGLTAHELGHNWSAGHCDGQSDCWIMCSGIGGCAGNVTKFGQSSKNSINNKKNSVSCLSNAVPPPAPILTSASPATIGPLGQLVTLNGTGLAEVTSATIGGQPASVVSASATSVVASAPAALVLGSVPVTVTNDGGTSNVVSVTYVPSDPPVFSAPQLISTSVDTTATWTFATTPGDVSLFLVALLPGTFNYHGFQVLASPLVVLSMPTNAAGVGQVVIPIDPSMGTGMLFSVYSQMAFLDPTIEHATPVSVTLAF